MKTKILLIIIPALMVLNACKKKETVDYNAQNKADIEKYVADNNLNAQSTPSGLYYVIDKQGSGPKPTINSAVSVGYKGYLVDGSVFDETPKNQPATFKLSNVIKGWQEGIQLFNEGGSGLLLIPSSLGYGSNDRPGIPAYSVLIFEIDLVSVF
jgi:FKBP-type peptidyl-prolyl cis-trans isomerase FkpA